MPCQVDVAPDMRSHASVASLESALSMAMQHESQASLNQLSSSARRSSLTAEDASAAAEQEISAPSAAADATDPQPTAPNTAAASELPEAAAPAAEAATDVPAVAAGEAPPAEAAEQAQQDGDDISKGEGSAIGYLTGLLRYRAPVQPLQNGKLESFDRKIGRAANALRVRIHPSQSWPIGSSGSPALFRIPNPQYTIMAAS